MFVLWVCCWLLVADLVLVLCWFCDFAAWGLGYVFGFVWCLSLVYLLWFIVEIRCMIGLVGELCLVISVVFGFSVLRLWC